MLHVLVVVAALAVLGVDSGAVTQDPEDPGRRSTDPSQGHQERPEDPPGTRPEQPPRGSMPRSAPIVEGVFESIQVNVDALGDNIWGDAANEPSIAIDPTDPSRIAIGWRQFDTVTSNFRKAGWAYSQDGGLTWTFPGVLEPTLFSSDPVLEFDLDGNFYYYSLQPDRGPGSWACYLYQSGDGGVTWPVENYAFGGDKAWFTLDRTGGIGTGNVYIAWSPTASCCSGIFTRSVDGGATFMAPIGLPNSPRWGTLSVGPDGELYVTGTGFLVVRSTNAQDPAVTPVFDSVAWVSLGGVGPVFNAPSPNPGGLLGQVWVATDHSSGPTRGNVYLLCSVDPPSSDPLDVMFSRSTDGGVTWSPPVRVNDDAPGTNAWQWFGTMSVAPDGRIDVVWNDTRNDPGGYDSQLFYAYSDDAGDTWSANMAVSPAYNPHDGWPDQNKIGDYYDMISEAATASVAYSATFNGEQDTYFIRLGDCNQNGVHDGVDISGGGSLDCNNNALPDECEDCNTNGIADECDIANGTSDDCNLNGVPDECEGDVCAPTPSPILWESPPAAVSTSEITMTAVEATDETLPVEYFFLYWPGAGTGGETRFYEASRTYVDGGLDTNMVYTYSTRARDSADPHNYGLESMAGSAATFIETPVGISFGAVTDTSIGVTAEGAFTRLTGDLFEEPPNQSGIFFEMTPADGTGANVWVQTETITVTGLTPGTWYTFRVKARNYLGQEETPLVGPVTEMTPGDGPCALLGDLNDDGSVRGDDIAGFIRAKLGLSPEPGENPACANYGGALEEQIAAFAGDVLGS